MITTHLKVMRVRRGIGAADLAARVGIARQTIYAIEAGSFVPNTIVALQLAQALDVSVEELFEVRQEASSTPPSVGADLLDESIAVSDGVPVRLCRVGKRLIAAPIQLGPSWLPGPNGVIAGRRPGSIRARVFSGEDDLRKGVLIAGCDPAISILSRHLMLSDGVDIAAVECSSRRALELLRNGKAHIAGMHLRDANTGEFNLPFVRQAFPRGGVQVITYGKWEQGFVVLPGNPRGIRSAADLVRRGTAIVNREKGSGSRDLLDRLLAKAGVDEARVRGYGTTTSGHLTAALAVLTGQADCCIATRSAAVSLGLDFVALAEERYDFVTLREFAREPPVKALFDALNRSKLRNQLARIAVYDTSETGSVRC